MLRYLIYAPYLTATIIEKCANDKVSMVKILTANSKCRLKRCHAIMTPKNVSMLLTDQIVDHTK